MTSVCGTVYRCALRINEVLRRLQRIWFPDGVDDPNMILIRFDVSEADYWDGHNSTVRRTIALLTSVITGRAGHEGHTGIARLD